MSIDSFNRREVEDAVVAGAELVLSCNGTNVEWASKLEAELVVIPDNIRDLDSLEGTIGASKPKDRNSGSIRYWNRSAMDSAGRSIAM